MREREDALVGMQPGAHGAAVRRAQWGSCALVGQAAGLRVAGTGAAVDAHHAVWRFNLQTPTRATSRWVGARTAVRVLNHPASHLAYDVALDELSEEAWGDSHQVGWVKEAGETASAVLEPTRSLSGPLEKATVRRVVSER